MPYRVDYRASVPLTDSQHETVSNAVQTWADGTPNAHVTGINRNPQAGQTEVVVYIDGLSYQEIADMQDALKSGVESLPESWPDPTLNASIHQYDTE